MAKTHYDDFIRSRITELRIAKNISEHKMSLDLDMMSSIPCILQAAPTQNHRH